MNTEKYTFTERELSLMARFTQEFMDFLSDDLVINHNYQDEVNSLMKKLKEKDISLVEEDLYRDKEDTDYPILYMEHQDKWYFPDLLTKEELKELCKEEYKNGMNDKWIRKEYPKWEDYYDSLISDLYD